MAALRVECVHEPDLHIIEIQLGEQAPTDRGSPVNEAALGNHATADLDLEAVVAPGDHVIDPECHVTDPEGHVTAPGIVAAAVGGATADFPLPGLSIQPPLLPSVLPVPAKQLKFYRKVPKFLDAKNFSVLILKFKQRGQTLGYSVEKMPVK